MNYKITEGAMTYKEFIESVREQADIIEAIVKESQVINLSDEMADDDTILFSYEGLVEELIDNVTGLYGHTIVRCGRNAINGN